MSHIELIPASRRLPSSPQAVQRAMERAGATQFEGDVRVGFATAVNGLAVLAKEVERLRTIVGQLDKTADNVPVIPHKTKVYHPMEIGRDGPAPMYITGSNFAWVSRGISTGTPHYETSECFSTPELAMASLEQAQPENPERES